MSNTKEFGKELSNLEILNNTLHDQMEGMSDVLWCMMERLSKDKRPALTEMILSDLRKILDEISNEVCDYNS